MDKLAQHIKDFNNQEDENGMKFVNYSDEML